MGPSSENIEVTNRQSFIQFLEAFRRDLLANQEEWENPTLERFLEAMAAYARAIPQFYINTGQAVDADVPSWRVFSDILRGAKVYE
jgi:hypothetical protein